MRGRRAEAAMNNGDKGVSEVVFFIDKEQHKAAQATVTVRSLLTDYAKEDPAQTTLAWRHGNETRKYSYLDEVITLENGMKFFVLHNTPTTVS
jgi:hypothetical protein